MSGWRSSCFIATRDDLTSSFAGNITVTGTTALTGNVTMAGDLAVTGDFTVLGNMQFGDVAADTLTMYGDLVWATVAPTYGIDLNAATPGTADIRLSNAATISNGAAGVLTITEDTTAIVGLATFGTFAAPRDIATAEEQLIMVSGNVSADLASGVMRGIWARTKISDDQTGNSLMGIEAQCRINGAASSCNTLGAGQNTGIWCYWEQSGTTALNTGNLSSAASCTVESAATLTIDSGAILAGVVVDSSVNASTTVNGVFDGIYIKKASGALDFVNGISFTDCVSNSILKVADDQTVCSDDNQSILVDISATTNAGFIKVEVGTTARYIALYALKSS